MGFNIGSTRAIVDSALGNLPGIQQAKPDSVHLDAAIDWLCRSQDVTGTGGSAATYNLLLGWEGAYPETSGYIVPTLFGYADLRGDEAVRQRAFEMAEWVRSTQHPSGSFPGGTGGTGDPNAFNTGQIIVGLAEAYKRTDDEAYLEAIRDACDWLVEAQSNQGHWAAHDYQSEPHVYTARITWPLLVGAELLEGDDERYHQCARDNLRWVLANQRPNGWFDHAAFEADEDPFLHTIAYTVRGLIEAGRLLDDDEAFAGGKRTADELLELQDQRGVLKGAYDETWSPSWYYCLSGNAQMALVWLRLFGLTGDREYLHAARTSVEFLKRRQPLDAAADVQGGLPGSYPIFGSYLYLRYPNWAVKFFADTLLTVEELQRDGADQRTPSPSTEVPDTEPAPLRMCLLVDGEHVFRWVAEAIATMLEETNTEITLVVINEDSGLLGSGNVKRGKRYPAYAAFWILAKQVLRRSDSSRHDASVHLSDIAGVDDAEWIRTYPTNVDGLWNELPSEVVDDIRSSCDIVFRRGFGLIRGDVLTATEGGVISYHHGDPGKYRGGPAGFWEFMNDERTAGMMVQSLRSELDAGIVQAYSEVDITDCRSWGAVRRRLYGNSTHLLTEGVQGIRSSDHEPLKIEELGPVYHPPSAFELARYCSKYVRRNYL
jgi:hypothetical protein